MGVYRAPERALSFRNNEFLGDLAEWNREHSPDNSEQLERLRRNLRKAREAELTPRQQQMIRMYYDEGKTMTKIARQLHVNKSTVSRTLARGRARLKKYLKYSF